MKIKKFFLLAIISLTISCISNEKNKLEMTKYEKDSITKVKKTKDSIQTAKKTEELKLTYERTKNLRDNYLGFKYIYPKSVDFISEYGSPVTLDGTDNNLWIGYFPKGDFTVVSSKSTDTFLNIADGKNSDLIYDPTVKLLKHIDVKMTDRELLDEISSIRYGKPENLGKNCMDSDCIEYYPKYNFTTVTFKEFTEKGNFFTLKRIAIGKHPKLDEY